MMSNFSARQSGNEAMQLACSQRATLGECLLWDQSTQQWWWTDIEAATIHAWSPDAKRAKSYKLPDRVGSFAHCRSGRLLVGLAKGLSFAVLPANPLGPRQLQIEALVAVDPAEPRTRINDGRTDRRGFFVFGTINEAADKRPIGSFYQYSMQYGLRRLALPAVAIANSICFSIDGKILYFTDTVTRRIMQCDYDYDAESAQVSKIKGFVDLSERHAYPDGSVIDSDGCLWNAQWGAGRVVQYAPDGRLLRVVEVPAKNPTCPAFGGPGLRQLMVTTARMEMTTEELTRMPEAGSVFGLSMPGTIGVVDTPFDDR
jgi:sugar lactone lactonase YvrE